MLPYSSTARWLYEIHKQRESGVKARNSEKGRREDEQAIIVKVSKSLNVTIQVLQAHIYSVELRFPKAGPVAEIRVEQVPKERTLTSLKTVSRHQ